MLIIFSLTSRIVNQNNAHFAVNIIGASSYIFDFSHTISPNRPFAPICILFFTYNLPKSPIRPHLYSIFHIQFPQIAHLPPFVFDFSHTIPPNHLFAAICIRFSTYNPPKSPIRRHLYSIFHIQSISYPLQHKRHIPLGALENVPHLSSHHSCQSFSTG
jgi:hypothetical protein